MTRLLAALMLLLAALPLPAAMLPAAADTAVYFVSVFPGRNVYELEGHSALAVVLPDGRSAAFNYGVFDFDSPNFLWRFVKGETDYMAAAMPLDFFLRSYEAEGRRVEALRLDMTAEQKRRLLLNLNHDVHPAYRTYRYNYVLDNCATRPLAAVERSLGDTIRLARTFRKQQHARNHFPQHNAPLPFQLSVVSVRYRSGARFGNRPEYKPSYVRVRSRRTGQNAAVGNCGGPAACRFPHRCHSLCSRCCSRSAHAVVCHAFGGGNRTFCPHGCYNCARHPSLQSVKAVRFITVRNFRSGRLVADIPHICIGA